MTISHISTHRISALPVTRRVLIEFLQHPSCDSAGLRKLLPLALDAAAREEASPWLGSEIARGKDLLISALCAYFQPGEYTRNLSSNKGLYRGMYASKSGRTWRMNPSARTCAAASSSEFTMGVTMRTSAPSVRFSRTASTTR